VHLNTCSFHGVQATICTLLISYIGTKNMEVMSYIYFWKNKF